jgi:Tol biopolymer transport system component
MVGCLESVLSGSYDPVHRGRKQPPTEISHRPRRDARPRECEWRIGQRKLRTSAEWPDRLRARRASLRHLARWPRGHEAQRNATQPAVSRDGQRIAFVRAKSIWVMQRDGSEQTRITSCCEDWAPAWSPDGSTIYLSRLVEGKDKYGGYEFAWPLFRMQSDGSGLRQLTRPPASDHGVCDESPSVSPDGRVIALASIGECDRGNNPSISAIDPRGRPVSLTAYDDVRSGFDPAWAPVGKRIAFASTGDFGQSTGIGVASPGSRAKRVYKRAATDPAWSPDGLWLAFVRGVGRGTIWLVRPDGSGLRRVSTRRYDADPAWLPATR